MGLRSRLSANLHLLGRRCGWASLLLFKLQGLGSWESDRSFFDFVINSTFIKLTYASSSFCRTAETGRDCFVSALTRGCLALCQNFHSVNSSILTPIHLQT